MRKIIHFVLVFVALFIAAQPVEACKPTPEKKSKVMDCEDLGSGYGYGFRLNGAPNGKFHFVPSRGHLSGGAPADPNNYVKISRSNGYSFDWSASLGIDAVIISGGSKSRVVKASEITSGRGYDGPRDSRGKPYKISSIEFCYDYQLSVSKTAKGTAAGSVNWEITKDVAQPAQAKFIGETARFDYTVAVRKVVEGESGFNVSGEVVVKNDTPAPAYIKKIQDTLYPYKIDVDLDCNVRFPYKLYPGKRITCTYSEELDRKLEGKNKVSVVTYGRVDGASAEAPIEWTGTTTGSGGLQSVTVTDTQAAFGGPYTVSEDTTWTYSVDLACPKDPEQYVDGRYTVQLDNTAAIVETGQQDSEKATLDCYAPVLTPTVSTQIARKYLWSIDKSSEVTDIQMKLDDVMQVPYIVTVQVDGQADSGYKVAGTVAVANPHPASPMTVELYHELTPVGLVELVDCANPLTVPASGVVECHYETPVANGAAGESIAMLDFGDYYFEEVAAYDTASASPVETDACVTVSDDKAGPLGELCVDTAPKTFTYTLPVGPFNQCGVFTYRNTASFVTNDTQTTGSDAWDVYPNVDCDTGCVFAALYWQAHAGPPLYNDTWDQIQPAGPASPFFETGLTWVEIFSANPLESAYVALAQEYMAARLNVLSGASAPQGTALADAEALLSQYAADMSAIPAEPAAALTTALHRYNTGAAGPQACCE